MAVIRLCLYLLYKETFFFVDSFYVFKKFIAILRFQKINYESNAKLIRLYVKIKSHLFKMLDK